MPTSGKNYYIIIRERPHKKLEKKGLGPSLMMKPTPPFLRGKNRGNASSKLLKWKMGNPLEIMKERTQPSLFYQFSGDSCSRYYRE